MLTYFRNEGCPRPIEHIDIFSGDEDEEDDEYYLDDDQDD